MNIAHLYVSLWHTLLPVKFNNPQIETNKANIKCLQKSQQIRASVSPKQVQADNSTAKR